VDENGFPFPLLSNPDRSVGAAYGTQKGPEEQGAQNSRRKSFLIDSAGLVRKIYDVTDREGHAAEVLRDFDALAGRGPA